MLWRVALVVLVAAALLTAALAADAVMGAASLHLPAAV